MRGLAIADARGLFVPVAPPHVPGLQRSLTGLRITTDGPELAQAAFEGMVERFRQPNTWFQSPRLPRAMKLHYHLTDAEGVPVLGRGPTVGDHGRITVGASRLTDWVHIEAVGIDAAGGRAAMTFRPARAPTGSPHAEEITHFYTDSASNTMSLQRDGNDFVAAVDVRSVLHNTGEHAPAGGSVRNHVYGVGTQLGGQKWMWDTWVSESIMAGLRGAGMTRASLMREPARVTGAATFAPDYVRDIGRVLQGRPTVGRDDARAARELLPYAW